MKISDVIERVLAVNADARNSDRELFISVWAEMGFSLTSAQEQQFFGLPSPETITRIRRKIQEQGRYPATQRIKKTREMKSMIMQQNMPTASVNTAERVLEETADPAQLGLI